MSYPNHAETTPARRPRGIGARLRAALVTVARGHGTVLAHDERAWASITFAGARHRLVIAFVGEAAVAGGETLITELAEHEFDLPRQFVAEATIIAAQSTLLPEPRLTVTCELLLLEEA